MRGIGLQESVRWAIAEFRLPIQKLISHKDLDTAQMSGDELQEAEELFGRTFSTSMSRFSTIDAFRSVAALGLPAATEQVFRESIGFAHDLFHDPQYDKLFLDKNGALEALGGLEGFIEQMTKNKIIKFQDAIDAASLIFAHSLLDGAALNYCRATSLASPSSWEDFVNQKRVGLQEVKGSTYDNILRAKIEEYLQVLDREALLTKIDRLFAVCRPPAGFAPIVGYEFDRDRLVAFDRNRHDAVHGQVLANPLPGGDNDIWFLMQTTNYLMAMVNARFDLKIDPMSMLTGFQSNSDA